MDILHINIVAFYPAVLRDAAKFEKIISKVGAIHELPLQFLQKVLCLLKLVGTEKIIM